MTNLKKQAETLGIRVDGRWSDERIQQEIDKVHADAKKAEKAEPFGGKGDHDGDGKPGGSAKPDSEPAPAEKEGNPPSPHVSDAQHDLQQGLGAGTKTKLIPVRIKRDIWDEAGERHRKGSIVELSVDDALDAVENGAASRVK